MTRIHAGNYPKLFKLDLTRTATVALRVTNLAGQFTDCDPALVTVGRQPGDSPVEVIKHVAQGESQVTVTNATPGVDRLRLIVDGQKFEVIDLQDGETRTLDVSSAMRRGTDNTIIVVCHGRKGSSAVVMIADT